LRVGSAVSSMRVPARPLKLPFTFEIIMCFTLNSALECAGSSFQVMVEAGEVVVVAIGGSPFRSVGCAGVISVATTNFRSGRNCGRVEGSAGVCGGAEGESLGNGSKFVAAAKFRIAESAGEDAADSGDE